MEQVNSLLAHYVKAIQVWDNDSHGPSPYVTRYFADGHPGLMFHQSEGEMMLNGSKKLATLILYGQTLKPITISSTGFYRVIVFYFYPHVLKTLFGMPSNELTDTCVDISSFSAFTRGKNVIEQLLDTDSVDHQVELIKNYLLQSISLRISPPDREIQMAVARLSNPDYQHSVKSIQTELRMTERTFLRKFEQHVGIPPKLFSKVCRFQRTLIQLESGKYKTLTDLAFEQGYADQSHFIRTFKEFVGETPKRFVKYSVRSKIPITPIAS